MSEHHDWPDSATFLVDVDLRAGAPKHGGNMSMAEAVKDAIETRFDDHDVNVEWEPQPVDDDPEHLTPRVSDRGFKHLPEIGAEHGRVRVYESSDAMGPHVWLATSTPAGETPIKGQVHVHLTVEQAMQVSDQLRWVAQNHYQGDGA